MIGESTRQERRKPKLPPEGRRQERERAIKAIAIISNYGQEADPPVRTIGQIMNHSTPNAAVYQTLAIMCINCITKSRSQLRK